MTDMQRRGDKKHRKADNHNHQAGKKQCTAVRNAKGCRGTLVKHGIEKKGKKFKRISRQIDRLCELTDVPFHRKAGQLRQRQRQEWNGEWSGGRWVERGKGEERQGKINSILTIDSIDQDREAKKTRIENERRGQIMKCEGEQRSEKQRERRDNWAETNWEN
ncbi:hypothetical protein WR25_17149 [Diploscapter pachys]|uniref:Uncharacterized protein n=1 Tax=Diploscapter pachys TaxID=2018661 RepID=A0A2A2JGV2_9BILA|nr:hypothetical protein WR25_17149 [Diploscapter pachys]